MGRERGARTLEGPRGVSLILFWYLLRDVLFSFFVSFLFFFFIFFVNQLLLLAQEILTKKVPFLQVAQLVVYTLPTVIAMAAPFASLVGTLMTVGRLTSDNEVLVLLSSGLSYANIFLPALAVGILISLGSFFTNDVLLPAGLLEYHRLYRRILLSTPALELESYAVKRFKDTVVVTGEVSGRAINDVLIMDKTSDGERRIILAKNAELKDGGKEGLSLDLTDAFMQSSKEVARRDYDYASASFLRYWVPQDDMIQAVSSIGPNEMSSLDVYKSIRQKETTLQGKLDQQNCRTVNAALELERSLRQGPGGRLWNRRLGLGEDFVRETEQYLRLTADRSLLIYRLEFYRKFSLPFGALSFVFLAVSLGLLAKKSGQTVGFGLGMIISFIYWAMLFGGQILGGRLGYPPFWCMWLPNILAITIGLIMGIARLRK